MRTTRLLDATGALITSALLGGTLIGAASANPEAGPIGGEVLAAGSGEYCTAYREAFADELGVPVEALSPAASAAAISTIDAAVANGDLPADVAERMKERVEAADGAGCRILGGAFGHLVRHTARGELLSGMAEAAAVTLGMSVDDLRAQLRDGASLIEIAEAQGVDYATVTAAALEAARAELDAAVVDGHLSQERADEILERVTEALEDGRFGGRGGPGGWGHGRP